MSRLIKTCREAIRDKKVVKFGKQSIDLQTAHVLVKVYEALSENSRAKFDNVPLPKLIDFCWAQVA